MPQAPQDHPLGAEPRFPRSVDGAAGAGVRGSAHSLGLLVPEPQFSRKTPAGRRSSAPASRPVPQPSPDQLRWVRGHDDGRLHLVQPADVTLTAARGYAQAVCGHQISARDLAIDGGLSGTLCMTCVVGATS